MRLIRSVQIKSLFLSINYFKSQNLIKFAEKLCLHVLNTVLAYDAAVPVLCFFKTFPIKRFTPKSVNGLGQLMVKVKISDSHLITHDPLTMLETRFNFGDHTMVQDI